MNPIRRFLGGSGGVISTRMTSKTDLNCASYFFSSEGLRQVASAAPT
jgi:hypothetical protein